MITNVPHTQVDRRTGPADPGVTCRTAGRSDLPTLVGLLEEIMTHHGVGVPAQRDLEHTLTTMLAEGETSERPRYLFLVAEAHGGVVGSCLLVFSLSTWSAAEVCELQDVIVSADERRAGVGRALLEAATVIARSRSCRRVFLQAEAVNLGAHAFYRSLGFDEKTALHFERDLS